MNSRRLSDFVYETLRIWRCWLNWRSHQRDMTWERFYTEIVKRFPLSVPRLSRVVT